MERLSEWEVPPGLGEWGLLLLRRARHEARPWCSPSGSQRIRLETLDLCGCGLADVEASRLFETLTQLQVSCRCLLLSNNDLGDASISGLVHYLYCTNEPLWELALTDNRLTRSGVQELLLSLYGFPSHPPRIVGSGSSRGADTFFPLRLSLRNNFVEDHVGLLADIRLADEAGAVELTTALDDGPTPAGRQVGSGGRTPRLWAFLPRMVEQRRSWGASSSRALAAASPPAASPALAPAQPPLVAAALTQAAAQAAGRRRAGRRERQLCPGEGTDDVDEGEAVAERRWEKKDRAEKKDVVDAWAVYPGRATPSTVETPPLVRSQASSPTPRRRSPKAAGRSQDQDTDRGERTPKSARASKAGTAKPGAAPRPGGRLTVSLREVKVGAEVSGIVVHSSWVGALIDIGTNIDGLVDAARMPSGLKLKAGDEVFGLLVREVDLVTPRLILDARKVRTSRQAGGEAPPSR